ncbi:MAG: phosphoribosylglycinamide formyltransferase [Bacteroidales bacterium]|nr:phosphoribosylglycinamide formyltransferase [Bacteroidales bacterium]
MKNIVIFASGNGSNAQNIAEFFATRQDARIAKIFCNKKNAYVFERAKNLGIPSRLITKEEFDSDAFVRELRETPADLIVLAGFLWLVPARLVQAFPGRIVNIHPALLPKFGGKGMYGDNVHQAVIAAGETQSGITIHLIDEHYDKGRTLFQARCSVEPQDTPETLAQKVHALEYRHFPEEIANYLQTL